MKKTANQLHEELTKKLITENYVDLKPMSTFEATPKQDFETKFAQFLNEKKGDLSELKPIVNTARINKHHKRFRRYISRFKS